MKKKNARIKKLSRRSKISTPTKLKTQPVQLTPLDFSIVGIYASEWGLDKRAAARQLLLVGLNDRAMENPFMAFAVKYKRRPKDQYAKT